MNDDNISPLNDDNGDDGEEEFVVLDAKNGQIKYIYRIAMMAGTQRQEARCSQSDEEINWHI